MKNIFGYKLIETTWTYSINRNKNNSCCYLSESGICSSGLLSIAASWVIISCLFPSLRLYTHIHNTHHIYVKILQHGRFILLCLLCFEFLPDSLGSSAVFPPSACLSLSYASTESEENVCVFTTLNTEMLQIPHSKLAWRPDSTLSVGVVPSVWTLWIVAGCWGQRTGVCGQGARDVCAQTELEADSHTPVLSTLGTEAAPVGFTNTRIQTWFNSFIVFWSGMDNNCLGNK